MNDVINHKTGTCIWYHSAPVERVKNILREGLKINSKPTWQANPEPWIYVSTEPWNSDSNVVFEVDLSFLNTDEAGWPFGQDEEPLENRWQLRVFKDIPSSFIKPMNPDYIKLAQIAYDTVLQTMVDGEKTHPDNDWQHVDIMEHFRHAIDHLANWELEENDEDHLAHAITRLAIIKYLEGEGEERK